MSGKHNKAFTLAELLIALAILGVIATFTIPKVLQSQQDTKHKAMAKEVAGSISGAFQAYRLNNPVTDTFGINDLTPFLNYVQINSSAAMAVDLWPNASVGTNDCSGTKRCVVLHNGGVILYWTNDVLGGTASTNAVPFVFDPDPNNNSASTTGPGKSVEFFLSSNGQLKTWGSAAPGTTYWLGGAWDPIVQDPAKDPTWFSWD